MARFDNLSLDYMITLDPMLSFTMFLDGLYASETEFGAEDEDESNHRTSTCYLDYMFVWLVEGDGALTLPTFEDWLLGIIRFADDLYSPRAQYGMCELIGSSLGTQDDLLDARTSTTMGLLDWGALSRDEQRNDAFIEDASKQLDEGNIANVHRPADEEGMRHPALDRNVYMRCRERSLERRQKRLLERQLEDAVRKNSNK